MRRCFWRRFFSGFSAIPERTIPAGAGLIVSPGDGLVTETAAIQTPEGPRQRISIFLSVFNVHVNRSPIAGVLTPVRYQKGQYLNAMNPASADRNEQNIVTVRGEGIEVTFKQIAGLLARRIVFNLREGDTVERGQRVGLIKFGSRVDVLLPVEAVLRVKVGDRVQGRGQRAGGNARRREPMNGHDSALAKARGTGPFAPRHVPAALAVYRGQHRGRLLLHHRDDQGDQRHRQRAHRIWTGRPSPLSSPFPWTRWMAASPA